MANTFTGTINNAKVVTECLAALKLHLTPLKIFSLSVGSEPGTVGDIVRVPIMAASTATTNATDYQAGDHTVTTVAVTLSENISSQCHATALERSKNGTDFFEKQLVECAKSVAAKCLSETLELVTLAHFSAEGIITAANFDSDALLDLKQIAITTLKMRPSDVLNVLLDSPHYINLCKDPALKDRSASGLDIGLNGEVMKWSGLNIYEQSLAALTVYGGSEDLRGFIGQPRMMGVTVRPPAILAGANSVFDMVENVTDDETGLTLQIRTWVDPQTNTLWGCVETLWGADAVDGSACHRIIAE